MCVCVNKNYIYIQNCIVMLNNKCCICNAASCHVVIVDDDDNDNDS